MVTHLRQQRNVNLSFIRLLNRHITLQTKTTLYFAGGFLILWIIVSAILLVTFKKALVESFDEQLKARAFVVAQKTNVFPKIVPLPQGEESFTIIYSSAGNTDTLFKPVTSPFDYTWGKDSITSIKGWRIIKIQQYLENGGILQIIYGLPSSGIDGRIRHMQILISMVLPVGVLLSIVLAYWLSYTLLLPVKQVINLANAININNDIKLLNEPEDNNELKELIVSFNRMLLRIKEQSNRQTAFFASASHELRTPLSVMHTRLQVLMQESNSDDINSVYREQLREVQQLTNMVNDFLLLSELRSGSITISLSECNVSDIVSESIAKFKPKWSVKDLQFKIYYFPVETGYEVQADESKIKIIIDNLAQNAIKYAPGKSVIDIFISKAAGNITFTITNKIRYDINPVITDVKNEFYHSKPLHGEGYGLGLWIANQLAILQDIEIYFAIKGKEFFQATIVLKEFKL